MSLTIQILGRFFFMLNIYNINFFKNKYLINKGFFFFTMYTIHVQKAHLISVF